MTLETEIAIAILNKQPYWFLNNMQGIPLPTPQTAGTSYQQETYARIKAREIIENNNLSCYYSEL